jgi:hypothetical protein
MDHEQLKKNRAVLQTFAPGGGRRRCFEDRGSASLITGSTRNHRAIIFKKPISSATNPKWALRPRCP